MKNELKLLLQKQREEDDLQIRYSPKSVLHEQFQNPQAILRRFVGKVGTEKLIEISQYYVDDFIRTTNSFNVNPHSSTQPPYFHKHDFAEFIYVVQGQCKQRIGSIENILVLETGEAVLLHPSTAHALYPAGVEDFIVKIQIPQDFLYQNANASFRQKTSLDVVFDFGDAGSKFQYIVFKKHDHDHTNLLIENLIFEYYSNRQFRITAAKNYLSLLFIEIFRNDPEYFVCTSTPKYEKLKEYIEANYSTVTLKNLAKQFGYSEKYMSRLIRNYFGTSFQKLISSLQIKNGTYLLANTNLTVEQIAHTVGFKQSANFYRLMNRRLGLTPSQIRRNKAMKRE